MVTRIRNHVRSHVIGYVAIFIAFGGVAYAAIPSASGEFTGCYATTNGLVLNIPHSKGDLRLVEPNEACRSYERRVTWNQEGPPGEPGQSATDLWVVLNADGSVASGSHVTEGGGTTRVGPGNYLIQFDRNIADCASVVSAEPVAVQDDPVATLRSRPSQFQIQVFTRQLTTGAVVDSKVHAAIHC
jgi:hypothetical protein